MDSIAPATANLSPLGATPESLANQLRASDSRSIERASADFESTFVSLVLKEMRQTLEPGTLFGSDAGDTYGGLFDLYLSQHLAKSGGFGIADMIRRYLESRESE